VKKAITVATHKRLKAIHKLSRKYNGQKKQQHEKKLLFLMREHIDEIDLLYKDNDPHCLVEIGDLIILCFEMLLENKHSIDDIVTDCFKRYERKLTSLIKEKHK